MDELEKMPEVAAYYAVWNDLRDTLEGYYKSKSRQHNALSQQKEFRVIKNAIIQEAERLRQQMEQESSQGEEPSAEETSRDASTNPTLADENTSSPTSHSVRLPSEYLLNSTIRLFHQMVQIFRENAAPPSNPMGIRVDSKRRKKLIQKRLAMGNAIKLIENALKEARQGAFRVRNCHDFEKMCMPNRRRGTPPEKS